MMISLTVVIVLISLNALYVAAEFAAVSLPVSRVRPLAEKGNRLAQRLLPHLEDGHRLDRFIAACQVGITWTSLVLGAYGQAAFASGLADFLEWATGLAAATAMTLAVLLLLVVLTSTQMILGELVPKSLALHSPLRTSLLTILPMQWSLAVYSWFIKVLNGSGLLVLKLAGREPTGHRHVHSPDELAYLLKESGQRGALSRHEEERLLGALKLSRRPVRQLMTPRKRMRTLRRDTPPESVVKELLGIPFTRIPVTDEEEESIVGLVYAQDVLKAYLDGARAPSLTQVMRPAFFVPEQMTADKLYAFFREHAAHQVMVVDEFGSVSGLVTVDDFMAEMLGDMPDEFKQAGFAPERLPDGRIRLPGLMRIDEAGMFLSGRWTGEAATLGGAVLESLGRLPMRGERLSVAGTPVEVERVEGSVIATLILEPAATAEADHG